MALKIVIQDGVLLFDSKLNHTLSMIKVLTGASFCFTLSIANQKKTKKCGHN